MSARQPQKRRQPRSRAWMQLIPWFICGTTGSMLTRWFGWPGLVLALALAVGWGLIVRRDGIRLREPRREDSGIVTRFGRVTGRRRSALTPERCLARLAAVLDHDDRFRVDALTETTAKATRLGNSVTSSYPLEITATPTPDGAEVVIDSDPPTSVPNQEEDTVRVVEDLLDAVGSAEGTA